MAAVGGSSGGTDTTAVHNQGVACHPAPQCLLCGSAGVMMHTGLVDHEFGAPGRWSTRRCTHAACGLAWIDPRPLTGELGKLYLRYYTHGDDDGGGEGDGQQPVPPAADSRGAKRALKRLLATVFFWRRGSFRSDRSFLEGMPPGKLLDVGCGSGRFLASMARVGWDAHGIDFDAKALEVASRHAGVTVAHGDLLEQRFATAAFDAVHLGNVIEHLPNPVEVIAECFRLLKPRGRLVVITPNIRSRGHRLFGADWRGLEPPRHLFLFDPRSAVRLATQAGFASTQVFTVPGDAASARYMVERSNDNARHGGRPQQPIDVRRHVLRQRALDLLGIPAGDWLVLLATK